MIRESEVFYIGIITKARGIKGEVEMRFTDDAFDRGDAEYLVIETDGILVPFFWEEYRFKNQETAILKFEDVDTEARAKTLAGDACFIPSPVCPTTKMMRDCALGKLSRVSTSPTPKDAP